MKKVLVTAYHQASVNSVAPVVRQLRDEGKVEVKVLAYSGAVERLQKRKIVHNEIPNPSLNIMLQEIDSFAPDLILTGTSEKDNNNPIIPEQILTQAGKAKQIPSLAIADYWVTYKWIFGELTPGQEFIYLPNKVAVMNEQQLQIMLKEGFPREIIEITGNPHFDEPISLKETFSQQDRQRIRSELGILDPTYLIQFVSQPIEAVYGNESDPRFIGYTEKTVLRDLIESLTKIKRPEAGLSLLVKVSPKRETKQDLEKVVGESQQTHRVDCQIIVDQEYDTLYALAASDLVVSPFSMALIESSILGRPTVSLQPGLKVEDKVDPSLEGVTARIHRKEDIVPTLERVMYNQEFQQELERNRDKFRSERYGKGDATQRVVDLVYSMLH